MSYQQIPLNLHLRTDATLDNFVTGENAAVLYSLQQDAETYIYLWGEHGCGRTHLLQAMCQKYWHENKTAAYIPLSSDEITDPDMLCGLEGFDLVCLDDIDIVSGKNNWELEIFKLFNNIREQGGRLLVAANASPSSIGIQLADLESRLNWGVIYQLAYLNDDDKITALQARASQRGFSLPEEVADYLIKRSPRDMSSLFNLLDKLDTASLVEQRKLTIPFVRQFL